MGMGVGWLPPGLLWSRGLDLNTNHDLTPKDNVYKRFRKTVCLKRKYNIDLLLKTGDILQKNNSFNDDDFYYFLFFKYIYITLLI